MGRAFRLAIFAAVLPLISASATDAGCIAHPHHSALHRSVARKAVHHVSGVGVAMDQARIVAFAKPVKTVFIGNPAIADVTMIDPRHAFVLGKTFGVTNLIAIDADGTPVTNQQVTVLNAGAAVTVNRGADQFNYMCTSVHCETMPRPGDPKPYFDNTEQATAAHQENGLKNATNAGTNSQIASGQ
jgi:hypothetical protein